MFILLFVVSFGAKKGVLASYTFAWYSLFTHSFLTLTNTSKWAKLRKPTSYKGYYYRFQHTALTSRLTIYVLSVF